jgi:hypothetical protein
MVYDSHPPYEILRNGLIDFATMHRLRRFARYWDLIGNSGNFVNTLPLLWSSPMSDGADHMATKGPRVSPFYSFLALADWLHSESGRTDGIALSRLMELLFTFLSVQANWDRKTVARSLWADYQRGGRSDKPNFLREFLRDAPEPTRRVSGRQTLPRRQARHTASR